MFGAAPFRNIDELREDLQKIRLPEPSIQPVVWHYTSCKAFRAIMASRVLWATRHDATNDGSEIVHSRATIIDELERLAVEEPEVSAAAKTIHEVRSIDAIPSYLVSFSRRSDDASQWDRYADQNRGVALAVSVKVVVAHDVATPPVDLRRPPFSARGAIG